MWFCFPSQEEKPDQAENGWGRGVLSARRLLRQWEQQEPCPSRFTGSSTPPLLLVWETEEGEVEQDFVFSGKPRVGAALLGRGLQGGEAIF